MKRIFHWNAEESKFDVVKVNSAESGQYETHADIRLFAGLVSVPSITLFEPHALICTAGLVPVNNGL